MGGQGADVRLLEHFLVTAGHGSDLNAVGHEGVPAHERIVVRQHALDLLGRKKEAAVALAFLKTHRDADRDGYLDALVRKGAVAPAAAELIKMLETPSDRDAALWSVQTFRSSEKGPHNKDFARTRETMLSRGDVRAAIEKVGQRFDWPLYN